MKFLYRIYYRLIRWLTRPSLSGQEYLNTDDHIVYVQAQRALTDLFILDLAITDSDHPSPLDALEFGDWQLRAEPFIASPGRWSYDDANLLTAHVTAR